MNRINQLDALRAFAVLGVLLHHGINWKFFLPLGPYSVRLFFVLSGFLITGILLRARDATADRGHILRAFYARRFLRIFPIYYLSLAILWLVGQPDIRSTILWHLAYASNILNALPQVTIGHIWGHLWSLSVEEQFYLCWPAIILFVPRRYLLPVLLAITASGPVFRFVTFEAWHYRPAVFLTPGCLDSLGLGAVLAWLAERPRLNALRTRFANLALVAGLLLVATTFASAYLDVGYKVRITVNDLGAAMCSVWLVNGAFSGFPGWFGAILNNRLLRSIGTVSYGIYLFHNFVPPCLQLMSLSLPEHGLIRLIVIMAVTLPLAALSWTFFERPLNDLKELFPYRKTEVVVDVPSAQACAVD